MGFPTLQLFIEWAVLKYTLHITHRAVYFRDGEIWWGSLGANIGYEQNGKNKNFERPVLVLKKFNKDMLWVIPLTTKIKNTQYHFVYILDGKEYSAILSQLRLISSKRLLRKLGIFPLAEFGHLKEKVKNLL